MSFFKRPVVDKPDTDDELDDTIDPELRLRTVRTAASAIEESIKSEQRAERRKSMRKPQSRWRFNFTGTGSRQERKQQEPAPEDQANQQPILTSTSSVNNLSSSSSKRAIPILDRGDSSTLVRSIASTNNMRSTTSDPSVRLTSGWMMDGILDNTDNEGDDNSHDEGHSRGGGRGVGGGREDKFDFGSLSPPPYATAKPRHPMVPVQPFAQSSPGESKSGKSNLGSSQSRSAMGGMDAVGPRPQADSSDFEQHRAEKKSSVIVRKKNGPANLILGPPQPGPPQTPPPTWALSHQTSRGPLGVAGGSRRQNLETVPPETFEQSVEKERQKKRIAKEKEGKEHEERERERWERERERERPEQGREQSELEREEKRVLQERERERERERQREREREQKERERERQESERERQRLEKDKEEREAREREEERKNIQTEKMLQELKDAREKAEEALRLAQEAAEFKKIAEGQAEELKRRMENADKLTRQALAKHGEAERQHREALELQERATMKEKSARRKELDIMQREKDLKEKEAQLQKLEEETKHQEERIKHEEELSAKKEETERLDEESKKKCDLEGAGQLDEGGRNMQMHARLAQEGNVGSTSVNTRGEKATFGPEVEEDREMGAVPASEITKKWKISLKSRIDQEIGILIQLNRQWFEENVENVKEDDRPHLQTELENITRSLDVLREISLEMFSGEVAEMVLLVERGSTEEGEAVTTDAAGDDREEFGASTASRARVPGPKEVPQALDPGRREEGLPEIEVVKAAEEPVADQDKINEVSVATQLEKLKNVNTPRQKSSRQGSALSSFAGARHFVIHHATFINSETANISPSHATNAQTSAVHLDSAAANSQQFQSHILEALRNAGLLR